MADRAARLAPLVNQSSITLFMATLGLSYLIEGAAQLMWGTEVHGLDLGIPDTPMHSAASREYVRSRRGTHRGTMVAALTLFFRRHPNRPCVPRGRRRSVGRACRRLATKHESGRSSGRSRV
jgi:hypothetical protein